MAQHFEPEIELDRESRTPLHKQISTPIEEAILGGQLKPGTLIENEVDLAKRLHVSRPTARRAMQTLVDLGLLQRKRGTGTVVTPKRTHRPTRLSSLHDDIAAAGQKPTTEVLSYERRAATSAIASALDCEVGDHVVEVERLRLKDGVPVAILYNWIPAHLAPSRDELEEYGLYQLFERRGITLGSTEQSVGAERPSRRDAVLLGISVKQPVLTIERTAFDVDGQIVEWGLHTFRGDLYRYSSTVFADTARG